MHAFNRFVKMEGPFGLAVGANKSATAAGLFAPLHHSLTVRSCVCVNLTNSFFVRILNGLCIPGSKWKMSAHFLFLLRVKPSIDGKSEAKPNASAFFNNLHISIVLFDNRAEPAMEKRQSANARTRSTC